MILFRLDLGHWIVSGNHERVLMIISRILKTFQKNFAIVFNLSHFLDYQWVI